MYAKSEYDRHVNSFSNEGRILQIEYAMKAMNHGSTALGVKTKEGVVLVGELRVSSKLQDFSSIEKIYEIDSHIGAALSGMAGDARPLIDHARVEAQNHWFTFNEKISVEGVTQSISDLMLNFGEGDGSKKKPMARPYGVSLLIAGVDQDKGPSLWQVDPSGSFIEWQANAIGGAAEGALNMLKKEYFSQLTLKEAEILALKILKSVMEKKIEPGNVIMYVASSETMRLERRNEAYITDVLKVVEEQVKNEEQAQMQA